MINSKFGFSAIEMLLALVVVGAVIYTTLTFGNGLLSQTTGQTATNQAYNYSQASVRYITTHQNLLRRLLSKTDEKTRITVTNGELATVSSQVLVNEGFIKNGVYNKNKLNQYPCTVIWYDNNQLQAFIYYRDDNNSKKLDSKQLMYGLNHMGAMIGLYENGRVAGAAKDWFMETNFISRMFVKQGTADISEGKNPSLYTCNGSAIAYPSYVVNITSMLTLNNKLPQDDTIHQYSDVLHDMDESQSNNRMNTDINMDFTRPDGKIRMQSNIIFQMNPDCQMNPNSQSSMKDYSQSNLSGCKNRQLAIQATNDLVDPTSNRKVMMVTGFQRGGNLELWKDGNGKDIRPYVGEVRAASLQPTTQIDVGTACDPKEIGTMAQQSKTSDSNDVNNIYVSQVICMKSPLCEADTNGFCYMPVQNVTLQIRPGSASYTCPVGTFIDDSSISIKQINILGKVTCVANKGSIVYPEVNCVADAPSRPPLIYTDLLNTEFKTQIPLYRTLVIPPTSWQQWCGNPVHGGCGEGAGEIADTQDTISKIQCTNDPSKAAIIIQR
jgi:hypothetical protein